MDVIDSETHLRNTSSGKAGMLTGCSVDKEDLENIENLDAETSRYSPGKSDCFSASSDESYIFISDDLECKDYKLVKFLDRKSTAIEDVLSSEPIDLEKLKKLAMMKGGLVKDELRRRAWPCLMHMEKMIPSEKPSLEEIEKHKDYRQVVLDVNRTLKRFPPGIEDQHRYVLMDQLTTLIVRILDKHSELHYYQGYHDVAITFLLVMGENGGYELVERLSVTHLHEFMKPTMERTVYYLTYLYPVLNRVDSKLHDFLISADVGTMFCLPWLITWYAHALSDYRNVVRLYDFLLASPYLMPMYIAAAIVLFKRSDILAAECDLASQHAILSHIPDSLPFEEILIHSKELYSLYPPDDMQVDVEEHIRRKNEQEEQLSKKRRSRRAVSNPSPSPGGLTPFQKGTLKILAFTASVAIANTLYYYYHDQSTSFNFLNWVWR